MLTSREEGFSLVEMMIAIVILTVAVLGVAGSAGTMALQAGNAELKSKAVQAVEDRISKVSLDPRYSKLDSLYDGSETAVPGMPGYTRVTDVATVTVALPSGKTVTYQKVTVTVDGPALSNQVGRTVVLGAP